MKSFIFILLICFNSFAFSKPTLTDNIKIEVLNHKAIPTDLWVNTSNDLNVRIQLNIKNIIKITVIDNAPFCIRSTKQLFLLTSKKSIMPESFNVIIKAPCIINYRGDISIHILTLNKQVFYNTLVFRSVYNSQL